MNSYSGKAETEFRVAATNNTIGPNTSNTTNNAKSDDDYHQVQSDSEDDSGIATGSGENNQASTSIDSQSDILLGEDNAEGYEGSIECAMIEEYRSIIRSKKLFELPSHLIEIRGPPYIQTEDTSMPIKYSLNEYHKYAATDTSSEYSYFSLAFTHTSGSEL